VSFPNWGFNWANGGKKGTHKCGFTNTGGKETTPIWPFAGTLGFKRPRKSLRWDFQQARHLGILFNFAFFAQILPLSSGDKTTNRGAQNNFPWWARFSHGGATTRGQQKRGVGLTTLWSEEQLSNHCILDSPPNLLREKNLLPIVKRL